MTKKRYQTLKKTPGIYKDTKSNRYQARKKIREKQYSKTFDTIREAQRWRNTFNGSVDKSKIIQNQNSTLNEVWMRMQTLHFPSLEKSTTEVWIRRWKHLSDLKDYPIDQITSTVINKWIQNKKKWFISDEYSSLGRGHAGRCNLNNELNLFTTIFNWYRSEDEFEEESSGLTSPIRSRHKKMGFIKETHKTSDERKIPVQDAFKLFSALPQMYSDLAMVQFFCAGRISEIAGIQIKNIDLEKETLLIKESISWCNQNKTFEYLKPYPKNKEHRLVHLHDELMAIVKRRLKLKKVGCDYLFHIDGRPLNYCTIQSNYKQAQRKTGIKYSGTHCLRHGMATLARRVGGSGLDSVIAMTGHKDMKLADHYSKVMGEVQKETSNRALAHIKELGLIESEDHAKMADTSNVIQFSKAKKRIG